MRAYAEDGREKVAATSIESLMIVGTAVPVMFALSSCREEPSDSDQTPTPGPQATSLPGAPEPNELPPPDLSECTRIEIEFLQTALDYVYQQYVLMLGQENMLSSAEINHLESVTSVAVEDRETIDAFARKVASGKRARGIIRMEASAVINCFRGDVELVSFILQGPCIYILKGPYPELAGFEYSGGWVRAEMLTKQLEPFQLRCRCARYMWRLAEGFASYFEAENAYPSPAQWCSALLPTWRKLHQNWWSDFKCPGAPDTNWTCAMNAACEPNSPPDTVLLFEMNDGWNRCGGPELFTFDHHDPRGGCVVLNDRRTAKFIRTEEELTALRWK